MHGVLAAFSGFEIAEQAILADGDLVAVRLVISGRHVGEFLGIAPTNQQVRFQSHEFFRVEGDKLAEQWVVMDVAGLLQQLGAVPKS
jgi:predicted ester cyclase